jgi:hypothetical protein
MPKQFVVRQESEDNWVIGFDIISIGPFVTDAEAIDSAERMAAAILDAAKHLSASRTAAPTLSPCDCLIAEGAMQRIIPAEYVLTSAAIAEWPRRNTWARSTSRSSYVHPAHSRLPPATGHCRSGQGAGYPSEGASSHLSVRRYAQHRQKKGPGFAGPNSLTTAHKCC